MLSPIAIKLCAIMKFRVRNIAANKTVENIIMFVVFVHFTFPSPPKSNDRPLPPQHESSQHESFVRVTRSCPSLTFSFVFCELAIIMCLLRKLFKLAREAR